MKPIAIEESKLRPCPFCCGTPTLEHERRGIMKYDYYHVKCECGARMESVLSGSDSARYWNLRKSELEWRNTIIDVAQYLRRLPCDAVHTCEAWQFAVGLEKLISFQEQS